MKKSKLNIYKVIWLFLIGCILGYIFETVFFVLKYGHYINKQGLIIGPFKPIYGSAVIIISFIFSNLKNDKKWHIFIVGVLAGTIFEYLCSWLLEVMWGFYIWDYSSYNWNINGSIYLPYCLIWGVISVLWYCYCYPIFNKIYEKLENTRFKIISWVVGIFLIIDLILTGCVYLRKKYSDLNNQFFSIVDKLFPEKEVNSKFPKVRKIKK